MNNSRSITGLLLVNILFLLTGCTEPKATLVYRPGYFAEKPDAIVVRPFGATFEDCQKDADMLPNWIRQTRAEPQTAEDVKEGRAVSEALNKQIVATLQARGLPAVLSTDGHKATPKTATIVGQFVNPATGSKDLRPAIGFRADIPTEARVQLIQNHQIIGEVKTHEHKKDTAEQGSISIARQIADVIEQAYIKNGWKPAPVVR